MIFFDCLTNTQEKEWKVITKEKIFFRDFSFNLTLKNRKKFRSSDLLQRSPSDKSEYIPFQNWSSELRRIF